ncbi:hypothetical protein BOX15_Mlig029701g1 [Macrostomum lignano]|uniref:Protein SCAI n=1 Tax=Macrostomum lignano TaxID=282301 RepID=A0A267EIF2_9PLAT|nr:hypothetical protein BOX15_Mlig029701g1 [Macrostomum lignano]
MSAETKQNGVLDPSAQSIVYEFCHLLEKSKQLFNGLRDLPQYGHKQWQSYFGRAFDVYTKLWKFQQQHRELLDGAYGLKRWQIGEIASKIGQLYYHYYLRTSETNYLNESFAFYSAIRMRAYYSKANKEERPDLMVKKLRYYARFVIVCLLLKKMKLVRDLIRELAKLIDDYTGIYQPADALEWSMVLQEIKAFMDADSAVQVVEHDSSPVVLTHRLGPATCPPTERSLSGASPLHLAEILIVGNCADQVKFSELTLDMFRMLQTLELEPQELGAAGVGAGFGLGLRLGGGAGSVAGSVSCEASPVSRRPQQQQPMENGSRRDNLHKYLLYKPGTAQMTMFLASSFKELPADGVLLLYISADGERCQPSPNGGDQGYEDGGVVTNIRRETAETETASGRLRKPPLAGLKSPHCIYPGDIYPYTRKPLFLVIDSDNSFAFHNFPNLFGQPLVCLMSPEEAPANFADQRQRGSLFTLFLHSPLTAFCAVCNVSTAVVMDWDRAQLILDKFLLEAGRQLARFRQIDVAYLQFYRDDFLRLLLLRYLFCSTTLRLHRAFRGPSFYPACRPPLPEQELAESAPLQKLLLDLALVFDTRALFGLGD